jgi:hypothetical protein
MHKGSGWFWLAVLYILFAVVVMAHCRTTTKFQPSPTRIEDTPPPVKGHWVMAEDGHAVYCYGPTIKLGGFKGEVASYATYCVGKSQTVKLHD